MVTCDPERAGSAGGSHRVVDDSRMVAGPWCGSVSHRWTAPPAHDSRTMSYKYIVVEQEITVKEKLG